MRTETLLLGIVGLLLLAAGVAVFAWTGRTAPASGTAVPPGALAIEVGVVTARADAPGDLPAAGSGRRAVEVDGSWVLLDESDGFVLSELRVERDGLGFPALGFDVATMDRTRFERWTEAHAGDEVVFRIDRFATRAVIHEPLPGSGVLSGGANGGFEEAALVALLDRFR